MTKSSLGFEFFNMCWAVVLACSKVVMSFPACQVVADYDFIVSGRSVVGRFAK